ncbi:hypothetical protein [Blastococcus sp. LR1]|uniref:hypothetical protein n=1 Tax=Blastococcus sp. LR1 TaxID=2877000 RepID=UPI001CCA885B|nr:hypothetical protein [Blastococcus sp. LR1]MCA0143542.1 hypothetical protein [Blastococcus sp. LR1]
MTLGPIPDKSTGQEIVEKAVEGAISAVPVVGGPAGVAFDYAISHAYDQRLQAWLRDLGAAVEDLVDRVEDLELVALTHEDRFLDAVAAATRIAERSSLTEKREALRNAVLNSALPGAPNAEEQSIFMRLIDDYTPTHLILLSFLADPGDWFTRHQIPKLNLLSGGLASVIEAGIPELANRQIVLDLAIADLGRDGLINAPGLNAVMTGDSLYKARITQWGQQFLEFVTDPLAS